MQHPALLRTRRPRDRSEAPRPAAAERMTGTAVADAPAAPVHVARPAVRAGRRSRWLRPAARKTDLKRIAKTASAYRRCSQRTQRISAPAPPPAASGASKATRRHGTWLLTHTQQNAELSKHPPSKQPFNLATMLPCGRSQLPRNAR